MRKRLTSLPRPTISLYVWDNGMVNFYSSGAKANKVRLFRFEGREYRVVIEQGIDEAIALAVVFLWIMWIDQILNNERDRSKGG